MARMITAVFFLFAAALVQGRSRECKLTKVGKEYRGTANLTSSGIVCQRWDSNSPHKHSNKKTRLPNAGLENNYCRNPDSESQGPWCYTTKRSKRWEFCDVKFCSQILKCSKKIDLVLIFEAGNGGSDSLSHVKAFFRELKQKINPSLRCVRLEFMLVWRGIEVLTDLSCEYDVDPCYAQAMERLDQLRGFKIGKAASLKKKSLVQAIQQAQRHVFSDKHGARSDAAKKVILVLSNPPEKGLIPTRDAVKDLQDMRVEIITVGVGEGRKENLKAISLNRRHIFRVGGLEYLSRDRIAENVAAVVMPGEVPVRPLRRQQSDVLQYTTDKQSTEAKRLTLIKDQQDPCKSRVDIGFLIDASGSVRNDYENEKYFVQRMAAKFGSSPTGSRAGVVVFSSHEFVETAIPFDQYKSFQEFKDGVDKLPFHGYLTRIDLALKEANGNLFTKQSGSRDNAVKILFLVTDGRQNPDFDGTVKLIPSAEAEKLHERGILIFTIGVGQRVNATELRLIASSSDKFFEVDDFDELVKDEFVKGLSEKVCAAAVAITKEMVIASEIKVNENIEKPTKMKGNGNQRNKGECCCGNKPPVYMNDFNAQKNTNSLKQQLKIYQSGHTNSLDSLGFDWIDDSDEVDYPDKKLAPKTAKSTTKEPAFEIN